MTADLPAVSTDRTLAEVRELLRDFTNRADRLHRDLASLDQRIAAEYAKANAQLTERLAGHRQRTAAEQEAAIEAIDRRFARHAAAAQQARRHLLKIANQQLTQQREVAASRYQQFVWSSGKGSEAAQAKARDEYERRQRRLAPVADHLARCQQRYERWARWSGLGLPSLPEADDPPGFDAEYATLDEAFADLERHAAVVLSLPGRIRERCRWTHVIFSAAGIALLAAVLLAIGVGLVAWVLPVTFGEPWYGLLRWLPLATAALPLAWAILYRRRLRPMLHEGWTALGMSRWLLLACGEWSLAAKELTSQQADEQQALSIAEAEQERAAEAAAADLAHTQQIAAIAAKADALDAEIARRHQAALDATAESGQSAARAIDEREPAEQAALRQTTETKLAAERQALADASAVLRREWEEAVGGRYHALLAAGEAIARRFPSWDNLEPAAWTPPADFPSAIPFGRFAVDAATLASKLPPPDLLPWPGPACFELPAAVDFLRDGGLYIETAAEGRDEAIALIQHTMLRLLTGTPPGSVGFTVIDPIGLGQSFAGFMHLADYDDALVGRRIWTEPRHIEQQLADLNEHLEKVIQKHLRNEFATIAEFNRTAGEMAERYRFLVICDFPANFSESAGQRLTSILHSGARCGVFTIIHKDRRQAPPKGVDLADLRRHTLWLNREGDRFACQRVPLGAMPFQLDQPPPRERFTALLHQVGEAARQARRVEVAFALIAPTDEALWSRTTRDDLRVPIGKAGANRVQELVLGQGTAQHALIAGKTGSGKSTLFHVIITSLALWYSPDEVELYLIDFKKGVEFKAYASGRLPQVRAVAIESDREFGLSILSRLDEELRRRGQLFRQHEVQDIRAYRQLPAAGPLPRTVLLIDEFQELFTEDDRIAQEANLLLDRLVRQGRAFGLHLILGSQTLGGAYSLARTTMGQMTIRIALQCSEADSYLILSDDNAAARLLARPGEAIYNDAAGAVDGNCPFQVTWLNDRDRDAQLDRVAAKTMAVLPTALPRPIVFEGSAPALLADNAELRQTIASPTADSGLRLWLGEPNTIKSPTRVELRQRSGHHLLIAGQNTEVAGGLVSACLVSLSAMPDDRRPEVWLLDGTPADSAQAGAFDRLLPHLPLTVHRVDYADVPATIDQLAKLLATRQSDAGSHPPIVLVIFGLQRFRQLRYEDDFSFGASEAAAAPDKQCDLLLADGPEHGLHVIAWCDTAATLNRTLSRRAREAFARKVLLQMSVTDSTTLIDTPDASRLGLHWALLYDEPAGTLEKFRPYALTATDSIRALGLSATSPAS